MDLFLLAPVSGIIALVFAAYLAFRLKAKSSGTEKMAEISKLISEGAKSYL